MNKIKAHRLAEGLTQQAFADLAGVPRTRVNEWENDKFRPSLKSRIKLAQAMRINQKELI